MGLNVLLHHEIETLHPTRTPLPITETGYRSHFTGSAAIEERGGPVAYVIAWLDDAAKSSAWKKIEAKGAQLLLF